MPKVTHELPTDAPRRGPARVTLTEKRMAVLVPPDAGELVVHDEEVPGLIVRLRPDGRPRWGLLRRVAGRLHRVALGAWPEVPVELARELAQEAAVKLARGRDPTAERRAAAAQARGGKVPILDALAKRLDTLRDRGRSGQHTAELERVARAAYAAGVRDLADPGVAAKADKWLRALDVSDMTRSRYRIHLIAIGKEALRWWPADVLAREPFAALAGRGAKMPPPPVFQPHEVVRLASDAALAEPDGLLWYFLLATGCRYKEAAWAKWSCIDLERRTFLVIPPDAEERARGARVKRDKARTVELGHELVEVLRPRRRPAGFLFPDPWRVRPHVQNVFAFRDHLAAVGVELDGRRIHSLRHSHACLAIAAGVDSLRLRLAMGHAGEEMAAHYSQTAMRWRGLLASWNGDMKLRDPAEAARLLGSESRQEASA